LKNRDGNEAIKTAAADIVDAGEIHTYLCEVG